jgi:hypothetical protein
MSAIAAPLRVAKMGPELERLDRGRHQKLRQLAPASLSRVTKQPDTAGQSVRRPIRTSESIAGARRA